MPNAFSIFSNAYCTITATFVVAVMLAFDESVPVTWIV
jgi:hypothetical protein